MKISHATLNIPHLKAAGEVEEEIGGREVLQDLCDRWGLKPYKRFKGFVLYAEEELDAALERRARETGLS